MSVKGKKPAKLASVPSIPSVRMSVRSITSKRADTARQIESTDEFFGIASARAILNPPYDPYVINNLYDRSNILRQCVEAKVTNVASYGWEIVKASEDTEIDENERQELQSFIDRANSDESLTTVHGHLVNNFERFGYGFHEIIRDKAGRISIIRHMKSLLTRLNVKHPDPVLVVYDIARGKRTSNIKEYRKFRTYVQINMGTLVYFKEFGDPRRLNFRSGQFETADVPVSDEDLATEVLHFKQISDDSYGVPRWIAQIPSILGSRESEEGNFRYFEDNTVPPMMLLIGGGRITNDSYNELQRQLNEGVGQDRQHKILLVEAVPESTGLDDKGTVDIKVEKLTNARQSDGLFGEYDNANQGKIMSSFRLGPILVGKSQDVNYSTANTSQFIAETQVFAPDRAFFDEIYNNKIVSSPFGLNLKTVALRSKAPSITNPETLVKSLTAANVMGAVTPRSAVASLNKIIQIELPQYPEAGDQEHEEWMDQPIQLTVAMKNQVLQGATSQQDKQIQHPDDGEVGFRPPEHGQE